MIRKALIISAPGVPGTKDFLPGAIKDLEHFREHLTSTLGGAWFAAEVNALTNPSKTEVRAAITSLQSSDYSFVVFCGHGYHSAAKRSTIIQLKNGDELDSSELRTGADRHTLILDCCRVVVEDRVLRKAAAAISTFTESRSETMASRHKFETEVERCPKGLAVLLACAKDETAGETSDGGRFSSALIFSASSWGNAGNRNNSCSVVEAFEAAKPEVQRLSGNRQNPELEKPRSGPYFPFAIKT